MALSLTYMQIDLSILSSLSGIRLVVGLIQMAITSYSAYDKNCSWEKSPRYNGGRFLFCKLPLLPESKRSLFDFYHY